MKMKRGRENAKEWFLIFSSFLVGSLFTLFIVLLTTYNSTETVNSSTILNRVIDSTVTISLDEYEEENGTGFIYKIQGKFAYILTNEHVIDSDEVYVTNSKKKTIRGKVLGTDKYLDLAVIRIDKKYAPNKLSKFNKKVSIGEDIYTVSSPINETFFGTVTSGVISGIDRQIKTTIDDGYWIMRVLQFDASTNPGSSGGPLINKKGEVLGICTMKYDEENIEGMSFATASKDILEHINTLESNKEVKKPDLGITTVSISGDEKDLPKDIIEGVLITKVKADSIAERNKLKPGDILLEINGYPVRDTLSYKGELYYRNMGDKVKIKYATNGKIKTKTIKLQ